MAETPQEGFWYFDTYGIQEAHDAGFTGEGVTIAVLDSQINLDVPTLKGADIEVQPSLCWDESGVQYPPTSTSVGAARHGTNVASFIVGTGAGYPDQTGVKGVAPGAKLLYFMTNPTNDAYEPVDCFESDGKGYEASPEALYIDSAVAMGAQIISVSLNVFADFSIVQAVARAEHQGVVIVGGLPNTGGIGSVDLNSAWPAAANGAVAVQRMDTNAVVPLAKADQYDVRVTVGGPGENVLTQGSVEDGSWEEQKPGYGTSFATPVVASFLALVKQKYPKATGNQLIQTLIRNTAGEDHPLEFRTDDGLGYGVASATHMLKVDPTQYPDVNPLIKTDPGFAPTAEMIANPPAIHVPDPPVVLPPNNDAAFLSWLLPVVVGGVVFLLLIIGVIVLVVFLATRRAKRLPNTGAGFEGREK